MRPPICAVCHKDFRDDMHSGGMIQFPISESERKDQESQRERGMVGHPKGLEWFCGEHLKIAHKYSHLPLDEAMKKIRGSGGGLSGWFRRLTAIFSKSNF